MMSCPGGVFHCSLGLMGEGNEPKYVCVCECVCVCLYVGLQYMMVCLPGALCCGAVMLSVTLLRPEPCSQRNQLWNWQVCLLHSPTLFLCLRAHTHTHILMQPQPHNEAHTQTHNSLMAWGLSTHAHTSPPTSTHIHRPSHKLQAVSLMPATNTVQKEYAYRAPIYIVATHNLNTFLQFDENQQWDWIGMWNIIFRLCFRIDSLPECTSIFI